MRTLSSLPVLRQPAIATLAVGAAVTIAFVGLAPTASAAPARPLGGCGSSQNPTTSGGRASWTVSCSGGNVTLAGSVTDTAADGKCAQVRAQFPSTGAAFFSAKACPSGTTKYYSWTQPGYGADGYLMVN